MPGGAARVALDVPHIYQLPKPHTYGLMIDDSYARVKAATCWNRLNHGTYRMDVAWQSILERYRGGVLG